MAGQASGGAAETRPPRAHQARSIPQAAPAERASAGPVAAGTAGPPARRNLDLAWIDPSRFVRTWRGRILLAALGWFPIGLAIFGIHGQVTGCSRYLASCTEPVGWSVWIPQLIVFALLLYSPRLAWVAACASLCLLLLTIPLAGLLTSVSGGRPASTETATLLVGTMALGWIGGVALALSGRVPLPPWRSRTMGT
jgi:hypothetical protein